MLKYEDTKVNTWVQARGNVPICQRCEDWQKLGIANRCPNCSELIITEYNRLKELPPRIIATHM